MKYLTWIWIIIALLWGQSVFGQGWEKTYGAVNNYSTSYSIEQTLDGGYVLAGTIGLQDFIFTKLDVNGDTLWIKNADDLGLNMISGVLGGVDLHKTNDGGYILNTIIDPTITGAVPPYIVKTDANGDTLWTANFHPPVSGLDLNSNTASIQQTSDGGYIFPGTSQPQVGYEMGLTKLDSLGQRLWTKTYPDPNSTNESGHLAKETIEGGYIIAGKTNGNYSIYLVKTDNNGDTTWTKTYNIGGFTTISEIQQTFDEGYIIAGGLYQNNYFNGYLLKVSSNGDSLWQKNYGGSFDDKIFSIQQTTDRGYVWTGYTTTGSNKNAVLVKADSLGNTLWTKTYDGIDDQEAIAVQQTRDGGYVWAGYSANAIADFSVKVVKTDSLGISVTNRLEGNIFQDNNSDCINNLGDRNLKGIVIKATNTLGNTYYATTDSLGDYFTLLNLGTYTISIASPHSYHNSTCQSNINTIIFNNLYQQQVSDFALTPIFQCPLLNVDISAPFIRPTGAGSNYTISYCNTGTVDAQNAYVEVELDPSLNVQGSSIPINTQTGNIYTFNLGTVAIGECGNFSINVIADSTAILGQTICTKANIFPDSICIPSYWNGPILETSALCANDTITFNVFNKGAPMSQGTQYFVYEDNVMFRTGTTNTLGSSGSQQFQEYALPGKSYRFEVKQIAGFPALLGDSVASASIEGCQPLANETFSTGFITQLSNGDRSPFRAVDCQQLIAAYDPNDKSAQPEGYSTPHYIYDYTPLDYKVRFQNTGTDTAFRVVIRDTLSAHLDVTSLEMGAASHNYTWRIYGEGILEVTFANIMLPDSNVNEPASNGFFRFRINQMPNNPLGTVINNSAAIYFDYNTPIITNTTYHTIGDNFVSVILTGVDEVLVDKEIEVKVYPNPFEEEAILEVVGGHYQDLELVVYDITGREVSQYISTGNQKIQIQRKDLPSGIYIYQLKGDRELISTGKIIIK